MDPAPVTNRDHPTDAATRDQLASLDRHHQSAVVVVVCLDHVQTGGVEHGFRFQGERSRRIDEEDVRACVDHFGIVMRRHIDAFGMPLRLLPRRSESAGCGGYLWQPLQTYTAPPSSACFVTAPPQRGHRRSSAARCITTA